MDAWHRVWAALRLASDGAAAPQAGPADEDFDFLAPEPEASPAQAAHAWERLSDPDSERGREIAEAALHLDAAAAQLATHWPNLQRDPALAGLDADGAWLLCRLLAHAQAIECPGHNAVTALLLGALVIQGVQPGPTFITARPDLFWGVVASMYVGNVFLLLLNLPLVGLWVQCLRIPYRVLFPLILLLSIVGTYSANKNVFDLWVMLGFGVAGYLLRKLQYEFSPFLIAFVLAPMLEQSLRQSMVMSPDGIMIFGQRPIAAGLVVASVVLAVLVFRQHKPIQPGGEI